MAKELAIQVAMTAIPVGRLAEIAEIVRGVVVAKDAAEGARVVADGTSDLALGLSRSEATNQALLKPFADSIGARTWTDPAFSDIVAQTQQGVSWQSISEQIIDRTVASGGRLHFNLAELDQGRGAGVTLHELQYILNDPALSDATTFYGEPVG